MCRKKIHYSCECRIEKSVPHDQRLSSLGKPRDAKRRSSGQIFLAYRHTHDRFLYSNTLRAEDFTMLYCLSVFSYLLLMLSWVGL